MTAAAEDRRSWAVSEPAEPIHVELSANLMDQLLYLAHAKVLFAAWAEEDRREADLEAYTRGLGREMLNGEAVLVLAFANGKPAGMVCAWVNYNVANGRRRLHLDRLYVLPEYRGLGILRQLKEAGEVLVEMLECTEQVLSCAYGSYLQGIYESWGFTPSDVVLRRYT